jgi:hypothetical protein
MRPGLSSARTLTTASQMPGGVATWLPVTLGVADVVLPRREDRHRRCHVAAEQALRPTSLTTSRSQPLRASLARPEVEHRRRSSSPVSAAKPTITGPSGRLAAAGRPARRGCRCGPVREGARGSWPRRGSFLILPSARTSCRPEVRDGGRHHDRRPRGRTLRHGLGCRSRADSTQAATDPSAGAAQSDVGADQRDACAPRRPRPRRWRSPACRSCGCPGSGPDRAARGCRPP